MASSETLPAPPSLAELAEAGAVALFLDFDGTLVDLAPTPDSISPVADLSRRLGNLTKRLQGRVALISGRAIADIERHIGPVPVAAAGSHGSDIRGVDGRGLGQKPGDFPEAIEAQMRDFAQRNAIDYETKPHGGALHYRSNPEAGDAVIAYATKLAEEHGWKAQGGKFVVELVKGDSDKGSAVRTLMAVEPFKGALPVFLGDDLTDEAGFAACIEAGGHGILVSDREGSKAGYRLPDVASVHQWLDL